MTLEFEQSLFDIQTVSVFKTGETGTTYTHTVIDNHKIEIAYQTTGDGIPTFDVSIDSIKNPGSTAGCSIIYTFQPSGETANTPLTKTFTPFSSASLKGCSISFNPDQTNH